MVDLSMTGVMRFKESKIPRCDSEGFRIKTSTFPIAGHRAGRRTDRPAAAIASRPNVAGSGMIAD